MSQEYFIIVAVAVIPLASVFYIPREKYRLALISFLVFQAITWAGSLILVQIGMIEYPVREFPKATQGSFVHLFVFIPMIFTWFILIFPSNASLFRKILHYFIFISAIVWYIYFISVYTDLEEIIKGIQFLTLVLYYVRFLIYFIICHIYISWFSKKAYLPKGGQGNA